MRIARVTPLALGVLLSLLGGALGAGAAELTVTVEGIRNAKGIIRLAVYASAAEWPDKSTKDHGQAQPAKPGSLVFKFELPPGTYAVNGYHDENGNHEFDTTLIGLPEEGYMFSNDVRPFLSAPSFASASISVPKDGAAIRMHVVYP